MNVVFDIGNVLIAWDLHRAFADVFPDRAEFDACLERTGVTPGRCLFIDDIPANVAGAQAAGMQAIQFTGAEDLRHSLTRRGLL